MHSIATELAIISAQLCYRACYYISPAMLLSHRDCIKHHIRLCLSRVNCYRAFTATNLLAVTLAMLLVSVELLAPWLRCEEAAKLARCCLSSYTSPGLVARQDIEARSRQTFEDDRDWHDDFFRRLGRALARTRQSRTLVVIMALLAFTSGGDTKV